MEHTFYVEMPLSQLRVHMKDFDCRLERMNETSCNVVFSDEEEVERFEAWAADNGVQYQLV